MKVTWIHFSSIINANNLTTNVGLYLLNVPNALDINAFNIGFGSAQLG